MAKYGDAAARDRGGDGERGEGRVHPFERKCAAHGCPELGSISHSNAGPAPDDSWLCRFHFGESSSKWSAITTERRAARAGAETEAEREERLEREAIAAEGR